MEKDEMIVEISTDKVDTEVPSTVAGTLLKILAQEKQTVGVGEPIASIGAIGEAAGTAAQAAPAPVATPAPAPTVAPPVQAAAPVQPAPAASPATGGSDQAVVMPKMGESIAEGTILRWLKKEGDKVEKDEMLVEISTDKVDTEVPSTFAGTLSKIVAQEKETVAVGATIAFIATAQGSGVVSTPAPVASAPTQATQATPIQPPAPVAQPAPQFVAQAAAVNDNRFYSPLVKSIAKAEGVTPQELATIPGSGLDNRVNKNDMLKYVEARKSGRVQVAPQQAAQVQQSAPSFTPSQPAPMPKSSFTSSGQNVTVIPMDNIRVKIAEHMLRSVATSPHVTSLSEVDVTNIINYQKKNKDEFLRKFGVKLTLTPIFIECMVKALREFPFINASIEGTNIIVRNDINFGIAVAMPQVEGSPLPPALIVPVIKQADRLSLAGLAGAVADLANKARTKKLTPDDISGGTFTFTNPGMFGNILATAIINMPQLAIMSAGAVVKRAVVKTDDDGNDYIAIRSMMFLGLNHDHRLIDGLYAVQFTERVKAYMEAYRGDGI